MYVLLTFSPSNAVAEEILSSYGYAEGENYIYLQKLFYGENETRPLSYYDWLEFSYGVDIKILAENKHSVQCKDIMPYSPGNGYSIMNVFDNFVFSSDDAVFDLGCGKGGTLFMLKQAGCNNIGGIEFDENIYQVCKKNLQKVGINDIELLCGDASLLTTEFDGYNYFFIYNSFQGEVFDRAMRNLEGSLIRKKRQVVLIYVAPCCHDLVIKNGIFALSKQIYTDYWMRMVNIYIAGE